MRYILTFIFTFILLNAEENFTELYKKAEKYEQEGNYKEAMILYKKAVNTNIKKEDKYILDLSKNKNETNTVSHKVQSFTKMKRDFYQDYINKTEDKETNFNLEQMITGDFGLYPYRKNYLLPATYDLNKDENRNPFETSFQFSIEKPIAYNFFGLNESFSAAYTQKSFWQTGSDSSPFRETNYMPEIFLQFPYDKSESLKGFKVSLIHESNGRSEEKSRSWNRLYLESYLQLSDLFVIPRVWYRIPEKSNDDDNPDIDEYYGYGDLTLLYPYKKHTFELMLRNNIRFNSQNKGAAELNWTFPLPEFLSTPNSYGFLQIFSGYGESLIDYDRETNKIGIGVAFSR
ncbi:phospholipase A [Poseidonibacter ostreae]|jgi:phospholipase A1/A2|uniref:Phosphatidylcholine 1-acylhydrolase n=1 Tax=Poseidonibacter ostreae TaxID=2654171 RepID=A0ABQ6VVQ6_9BACT|nr:phospholipase A [Poseidonibacter ostreae]KAB7885748.1 phospholipase [Poseidonibacter ostreae]KAB7893023.1 phospholipase [Poseidonibacter ostreae]